MGNGNGESQRFVCPGCGDGCTAKEGVYCDACAAFVHYTCAKDGERMAATGMFSKERIEEYRCPVCHSHLADKGTQERPGLI